MATVERLIKPSLKRNVKDGWEWSPEYVVYGDDIADEFAAFAAVDSATGLTLPYIGEIHNGLRCEDVEPSDHPGPHVWFFKTTWKAPTLENNPNENEEPPKARLRWKSGSISRQIAHDVNGNPIVNMAGVPYSESFEDEERTKIFVVTRREPFYDAALANGFEGCVNSNAMYVRGMYVGPGNMICNRVEPTSDEDIDTTAVDVEWEFELRQGYKPWLLRVLNQGHSGWRDGNDGPHMGEFYHLGGTDAVSEPVLLDRFGVPINSSGFVVKSDPHQSDASSAAIANPNVGELDYIEVAPESTSTARILIFKTRNTMNFAGLLPPFM
jgi:hypothetical protein